MDFLRILISFTTILFFSLLDVLVTPLINSVLLHNSCGPVYIVFAAQFACQECKILQFMKEKTGIIVFNARRFLHVAK